MPGFDFSNYNRNAALHARGVPLPKATSTGTTIVGCIYDNGVVVCLLSLVLRLRTDHLFRSPPILEQHPVPLSPIRIAKSFITSLLKSGALEQVQLQILNSPLHLFLPISNSTPSPQVANLEYQLA